MKLESNTAAGHEGSEVRIGPLALVLASIALLCVLTLFLMRWTFDALEARERARDRALHLFAESNEKPPAPRLQAAPGLELAEHRRREAERLEGYGWVDRSAGVVRIPIERALELVVKEGLPARTTAQEKQ